MMDEERLRLGSIPSIEEERRLRRRYCGSDGRGEAAEEKLR